MDMSIVSSIEPREDYGSFEEFCDYYSPIDLDGTTLREKEQIPPFAPQRYVWTVVDGDDGRTYVIPGWHHVNRIGYVLCWRQWSDVEYENPGYVYF